MLPDFRYRATDAAGIVENEICPVFRAVAATPVDPRPEEVGEYQWVDPEEPHPRGRPHAVGLQPVAHAAAAAALPGARGARGVADAAAVPAV
ncbi:hypothetical protein WDV94_15720 [Clavibacter tessellarius]